jgi:nucleoid-associated protein EbfC
MRGGIGNLMKQAQKVQEDLKRAQERLALEEVTGESGGGLVRIVMNGRHEARSVSIDPSLVGDDREMLEDLIAAAINDAAHKIAAKTQQSMAGVTQGLGLPFDFKF